MTFIPSNLFSQHEKISDEVLMNKNITVTTRLVYPELVTVCPNCIYNTFTKKSSGKYKTGGPIEFSGGLCPYCNGQGKLPTPSGENIELRMYYDKPSFRKLGGVDIPEGDAMCIGFIADKPKIKKAVRIIPSYEIKEYGEVTYGLSGDPLPWGLSKDKYFVAHLSRNE